MSDFAAAFRAISIPKLRRWVEMESICVARGIDTYDEAYNTIRYEACRLGANHLPVEKYNELEDWIARVLLEGILHAEQSERRGG